MVIFFLPLFLLLVLPFWVRKGFFEKAVILWTWQDLSTKLDDRLAPRKPCPLGRAEGSYKKFIFLTGKRRPSGRKKLQYYHGF